MGQDLRAISENIADIHKAVAPAKFFLDFGEIHKRGAGDNAGPFQLPGNIPA